MHGSALAAAAYIGNLEMVQLLVQQYDADVRTELHFGDYGSPLLAAVATGNVDCARFLTERGADANAYLKFGIHGCTMAAAILGP